MKLTEEQAVKITVLIEDLHWEFDRMSSSGRESLGNFESDRNLSKLVKDLQWETDRMTSSGCESLSKIKSIIK